MIDIPQKAAEQLASARKLNPEKRQHYFLVAGEISFVIPAQSEGEEPQTGMTRLNALVHGDEPRFGVAQIGKAQQALQLSFFNTMKDASLTVANVVLLAIVPLGQFTHEEFHARPKEEQLQNLPPLGRG